MVYRCVQWNVGGLALGQCGAGVLVAAAQGAHQLHLGVQHAGLQVCGLAALGQHGGLCGQHMQVGAQASLVALRGNRIRRLGIGLRQCLLGLLFLDGLGRCNLVPRSVQCT